MDKGIKVYIVNKHYEYYDTDVVFKGFDINEAKLHMLADAAILSIETGIPVSKEFEDDKYCSVGMYHYEILEKEILWQ